MKTGAAFANVAFSPVTRRWDEQVETSLGAITLDTIREAVQGCGLALEDVDAVYASTYPLGGLWANTRHSGMSRRFAMSDAAPHDGISYVSAEWATTNLGLQNPSIVSNHDDMFMMTNHANDALVDGRCKTAVIFRSLPNFQGRYNHGGQNAFTAIGGPAQYEMPYGYAVPALHASYFQRYLWKYGRKHKELAPFAVRNRTNGLLCEYGFYAQHRPVELTAEEYLAGRWIIEPLSIYDCDLPMMMASAFVMTTDERAKDLKHSPVYVLGQCGIEPTRRSVSYLLEDFEEQCREEAHRLWTESGVGPSDLDFAQLYDGFLVMTPFWAECFGFAEPGQGLPFLASSECDLTGTLPINTSGGNSGVGRCHGASHIVDTVLQLQKRAGARQIADAQVGLTQVGSPIAWGAQILSSTR